MCHADFISETFGDDPLNPPDEVGAGNYVFLVEDNLNDGMGPPISGDAAGHNIIAPSHNVGADETLDASPGGEFPSSAMGCTSCHDPHGNTSFRMLNGVGPVQDELYDFVSPAFEAEGLSVYHGRERNDRHTAYRSGVSEWCGNCHGDFHDSDDFLHVSGSELQDEIAEAYDLYNGTEDITGGSHATAYLALVPFEDPSAEYNSTLGPVSSSKVMCLTCHRAHASSAPDAGRWDFNITFLADDGVLSGSYPIPDPYNSPNQRSLCNKCHVKDLGDRIIP
jgi:cytochrome c553